MNTPEQLDDLVSAWHAARAAGRDLRAEELCRDCPDLTPKLAQRIALLRQMSELRQDPNETVTNPGTASHASSRDFPERIGDYHILTELGKGGMGAVYWAEDERLRRPTAVKVMRPELAARPGARERFIREARAAANVDHEAIVPIWHVGEDKGVLYIAMPLLRGENLADRLHRAGALPLEAVLQVGRDIAAGLSAIHRAGLVHRDIKPANIWLSARDDGSGLHEANATAFVLNTSSFRARILDFGLARLDDDSDPRLTGTGDVLGTPAYMAPEQARNRDVDSRADLFSLGCVLYHAATGRAPFRAATVLDTLLAVAQETPPDPRSLAPVPAKLAELINRLMAKNPVDRPASAADVLKLLEMPKAPDPPTVVVPPPPPPAKPREPVPPREPSNPAIARRTQGGSGTTKAAPVRHAKPLRHRRPIGLWLGIGAMVAVAIGVSIYFVTRPRKLPDNPGNDQTDPGLIAGQGYSSLDATRIPATERYTWQSKELVSVVGGHSGLVSRSNDSNHVAISPDGKLVAWHGPGGLRVWDSESLALRFYNRVLHPVMPCFSADSQLLVVGSVRPEMGSFGVRLIDFRNPAERGVAFRPAGPVTALTVSHDQKHIAVGRANGAIQIWDAKDATAAPRRIVDRREYDLAHPVRQLTFAADDTKLVALSHDDLARNASVQGWTLTDEPASELFTVTAGYRTHKVGVMPSGDRVAIPMPGKGESELAVWGFPPKTSTMQKVFWQAVPARCVDAEVLSSGSKANVWQMWLGFGSSSAIYTLNAGPKNVKGPLSHLRDLPNDTLAMTSDTKHRVYRMADGRLGVSTAGREVLGALPLADADHPPVVIGGRLFTFLPTPQAWEIQDGRFVPGRAKIDFAAAAGPMGKSPAVAPSGKSLAWRVNDAIHVYAMEGDTFKRTAVLSVPTPAITFSFGTDERAIRTIHKDGTTRSWDLGVSPPTNRVVGKVPEAMLNRDLVLSAKGTDYYSGMPDRTLRTKWQIRRHSLNDPAAAPTDICSTTGPRCWPSPNGVLLATDDVLGLAVCNARNGEGRKQFHLPSRPTSVQWTEDNRHLLVAMEGLIYILRVGD